jgi:tetratricopeptide (TPR) repeat protein
MSRHTPAVRWVWIVGLSLWAGRAEAKPHPSRVPAEDPDQGNFWRDVIEPHGEVVTAIVTRARSVLGKLGEQAVDDEDDATDQRVRSVSDAYGMLRYARKLSPENPEVLGLLGTAADELGKTRQALEALEACVRIQGPDRADTTVTGRIGMIHLRLGKLDDAIRWLRYAQGPVAAADNATAAVHLATALAAHGEMTDAIDLLAHALPAQPSYFTDPLTLVSFALAVHYDRDEQRGAAFEILDRMQATLQQELGPFVQRALAAMRFAPPEDQYYYRALLYEALGDYTEARAEWALYAAVPDAPWRRRALEHVHAIDAERSARPGAHRTTPTGALPNHPLHRRRPVP